MLLQEHTWPLPSTKDTRVSSYPAAVTHISQSTDTISSGSLPPAYNAPICKGLRTGYLLYMSHTIVQNCGHL